MADSPATTSGGEARGYSWPPFEPGNTVSLRHGAYSPRSIAPIAEELAASVVEVAPWLAVPLFQPEVQAWAYAEAEVVLLRRHMDEVGILDEDGGPAAFLEEMHRAETRAAKRRNDMGLSPRSWAQILKMFATSGGDEDSLAKLKATGAQIVAATEAAG